VTRAEREPLPENRELFFAVATMSDGSHRVEVGTSGEIFDALSKAEQSLHVVGFVSIHRVLHQLRVNAQLAKPKIALPERFTIAPRDPGYENWRREIAAHQERAEARFQAKAKAKAKPARAPASKRLVKA
jgi:hypothetical protein